MMTCKQKSCYSKTLTNHIMTTEMQTTQILPEFPGYTSVWSDENNKTVEWMPIPGIYSPPVLHKDLTARYFDLPDGVNIGQFIGMNGYHLKKITAISNSVYIFCKKDQTGCDIIEIWSYDPDRATKLLQDRLDTVIQSTTVPSKAPPQHVGKIIGKNGIHLKNMARMTGATNIYFKDNSFEVWGTLGSIKKTLEVLDTRIKNYV